MNRPARHHEPPGSDGALLRAKALADPTRAEIHRLLTATSTATSAAATTRHRTDGPTGSARRRSTKAPASGARTGDATVSAGSAELTIAELAALLEIHRTAIGQHLAILIDTGLVERSVRPPTGRGRPVSVYRALEPDPYRALAGWLAEAVRTQRSAREIGHEVGSRLATSSADTDPLDTVVREAARLGFAPDPRRRRGSVGVVDVVLQRCPYADVAAVDPSTVCQLHLGLAEGVAERTGGIVVDGLKIADPHRAGCRLTLRPVTPP